MTTETKLDLNVTTVAVLRDLIRVNLDSSDGLDHLAQRVSDPDVKQLLTVLSQHHELFGDELHGYVEWSPQDTILFDSLAADLHRQWQKVRQETTLSDIVQALEAVEHCERFVIAIYRKALRDLPGSAIHDILLQHLAELKATVEAISELRSLRSAANRSVRV